MMLGIADQGHRSHAGRSKPEWHQWHQTTTLKRTSTKFMIGKPDPATCGIPIYSHYTGKREALNVASRSPSLSPQSLSKGLVLLHCCSVTRTNGEEGIFSTNFTADSSLPEFTQELAGSRLPLQSKDSLPATISRPLGSNWENCKASSLHNHNPAGTISHFACIADTSRLNQSEPPKRRKSCEWALLVSSR